VVKLYAAAMFPASSWRFLYLVYIVGWAMINPKIAPPLPRSRRGFRCRTGCASSRRPIREHAGRRCSALFSPPEAGASRPMAAAHLWTAEELSRQR
jgi:TRAP-type mannitol/chloroaromatic compound transport system permease large subunit